MKCFKWLMPMALLAIPLHAQAEAAAKVPAAEVKVEKAEKPAKAKSEKKPFLNIKLVPPDQDTAEVKITPEGGEAVQGLVQRKKGGTYLLDLNGVLTNPKAKVNKKDRVVITPKKKKRVAVTVDAAGQSYPGMAFSSKKGFYQLDINNILTAKGRYRYRYNPHTFEISTLIGGDALFSTQFGHRNFVTGMTVLNIYTENRFKRNRGYTPLVQFRVGYGKMPFYKSHGNTSIGLLFGGSQYVFDFRGEDSGIGWSMLANGGMSFDFSPSLLNNYLSFPAALGAELEFKAIYNFHKYVGITFGFLIGYSLTADVSRLFGSEGSGYSGPVDSSGFPIYSPGTKVVTPGLIIDQNFRWAFSVGVIF